MTPEQRMAKKIADEILGGLPMVQQWGVSSNGGITYGDDLTSDKLIDIIVRHLPKPPSRVQRVRAWAAIGAGELKEEYLGARRFYIYPTKWDNGTLITILIPKARKK